MLLTLHISLAYSQNPVIWRRICIDDDETFASLHAVIQAAFGWSNAHLWEFFIPGRPPVRIGGAFEDDWGDAPEYNVFDTPLSMFLKQKGSALTYMYDFGDSWNHLIKVEKKEDIPQARPTCIDGAGACPPEDCGGIPGYEHLQKVIKDPRHNEYQHMRDWLELEEEENWDPHAFDLAEAQSRMCWYSLCLGSL
ncbi:MAG: plasmid pRiA4b ORF-3 family protein, partial [Bacteroidota bacterium]